MAAVNVVPCNDNGPGEPPPMIGNQHPNAERPNIEGNVATRCGACLRAMCTTFIQIAMTCIVCGVIIQFVVIYSRLSDKDVKTFLHQAKAWNDSVSTTALTDTQKKFLDQHQFTCFEMFTIKELSHINETISSTCTELPKIIKDIVGAKLSDKYKTRDQSFKKTVRYTPLPDESGQGIGYQLSYSRMPFGEEYRIIILVNGLKYTTSPVVHFEDEKVEVCEEKMITVSGGILSGERVQKQRLCRDEMVKRRKLLPREISQEEFETLITQKTKLIIQQSVIPQLRGELESNKLSI